MRTISTFFAMLFFLHTSSLITYAQEDKDKIVLAKPLEPKGERVYPKNFSDKASNFFMSKRFKTAAKQRDSLYLLATDLKNDTLRLGAENRKLLDSLSHMSIKLSDCNKSLKTMDEKYDTLIERYNALNKTSSNKEKELSNKLAERAIELELLGNELSERERRLKELESIIRRQDSIVNSITKVIKDALRQINSPDLSVEIRNGKVYVSMNDKILFQSGKSEVQEDGVKAINKLSQVLTKIADVDIMVEGHTDNVPIKTPQYKDNWDLSVARSTAITRLLIQMGLDAKRVTASGKAEFSPKASNLDNEGRAKNRRTEIVLIPKLDEIYNLIQNREKPL